MHMLLFDMLCNKKVTAFLSYFLLVILVVALLVLDMHFCKKTFLLFLFLVIGIVSSFLVNISNLYASINVFLLHLAYCVMYVLLYHSKVSLINRSSAVIVVYWVVIFLNFILILYQVYEIAFLGGRSLFFSWQTPTFRPSGLVGEPSHLALLFSPVLFFRGRWFSCNRLRTWLLFIVFTSLVLSHSPLCIVLLFFVLCKFLKSKKFIVFVCFMLFLVFVSSTDVGHSYVEYFIRRSSNINSEGSFSLRVKKGPSVFVNQISHSLVLGKGPFGYRETVVSSGLASGSPVADAYISGHFYEINSYGLLNWVIINILTIMILKKYTTEWLWFYIFLFLLKLGTEFMFFSIYSVFFFLFIFLTQSCRK